MVTSSHRPSAGFITRHVSPTLSPQLSGPHPLRRGFSSICLPLQDKPSVCFNTPSGLYPHVSLTPSSSSHSWNITGLCREERIQAVLHYPCSELGHGCLQPEHCPYVPAHEGWVHKRPQRLPCSLPP